MSASINIIEDIEKLFGVSYSNNAIRDFKRIRLKPFKILFSSEDEKSQYSCKWKHLYFTKKRLY